jgi:hypothetical protein
LTVTYPSGTKEKAEIRKVYFDKLLNTGDPKELIKTRNK